MPTQMKEIVYVCTKCGSRDKLRLFESEAIPIAINCWNCHAGQKLDIGGMVTQHVGMFPEKPEETKARSRPANLTQR